MAHARLKRLELDPVGGADTRAAPIATAPQLTSSLHALQGLKVQVDVIAGCTNTTLGELMSLQHSQLLKIDRAVNAPLDVVIAGQVVARGHLVAVGEHFGICISELVAQS